MKITQVAAQLYTCRSLTGDVAGVAKTIERLAKIGYTDVQASGLGPGVSYQDFARIIADNGMICTSTHESSTEILASPEKIVDRLNILGCNLTAYPYPAGVDFASSASVNEVISKLQHAGEIFARAGKTLCYHNHHQEFRKIGNKTILELIYGGTTREALQGEPDTYWVQYGGGDNVAWCKKLAGRLPMIHLKDYYVTAENKPDFCEIGAGVLDFKSIIAAAEASGCKLFVIEQDSTPGDPVDSLGQSFRHIQENLVS